MFGFQFPVFSKRSWPFSNEFKVNLEVKHFGLGFGKCFRAFYEDLVEKYVKMSQFGALKRFLEILQKMVKILVTKHGGR